MSKCSLDIEQHDEFKMSVLISSSKSNISSRWVTNDKFLHSNISLMIAKCNFTVEMGKNYDMIVYHLI